MTVTISTQQEWFSNYVSATMSILGVHAPDADGDLAGPGRDVPGVGPRSRPRALGRARVRAGGATACPPKAAVYKEINAATWPTAACGSSWPTNGSVMVDYLLLADAVNTDNLRAVIGRVLEVADELGPMLAAVHGGSTPIAPEPFDLGGLIGPWRPPQSSRRSTSPSTSSC